MAVVFPEVEQLEHWTQYPEVIDLAARFYDATVNCGGDYVSLSEDHKVNANPSLGYVIIKNLFAPVFVEDLINYAEERRFREDEQAPDRDSVCVFTYPNMKTGIKPVDYFAGLYFDSCKDNNFMNLFFNKYYSSRRYRGVGDPHIDNKTKIPIILLGSGEGYLEMSTTVIDGEEPFQIKESTDKFLQESYDEETHKIFFSDGDVAFFDGRKRMHRGATSSCDGVRYSVVAHNPKVKVKI